MKFKLVGIPYSKSKVKGDINAPKQWTEAVRKQMEFEENKIDYPCRMEVEFILPSDKFPNDFPCGPDLDNLLKRLLDALQPSFLENDSLIIELIASKRRVKKNEEPGAIVSITEMNSYA